MPNQPLINATVKITAKDINGGNIAKTFTRVYNINFDYNDGTVNIVDATGSYYFPLTPLTTFTYIIVANPGGSHSIVTS